MDINYYFIGDMNIETKFYKVSDICTGEIPVKYQEYILKAMQMNNELFITQHGNVGDINTFRVMYKMEGVDDCIKVYIAPSSMSLGEYRASLHIDEDYTKVLVDEINILDFVKMGKIENEDDSKNRKCPFDEVLGAYVFTVTNGEYDNISGGYQGNFYQELYQNVFNITTDEYITIK